MDIRRTIEPLAREMAESFRAIVVCGPRQVGKTWLLKRVATQLGGYRTVSFDDEALRDQARNDPKLFLRTHPAPLFLDEVQKVPELFPAMKSVLDADDSRGQFLMTGSQQFQMMKRAHESLAGRIGILRLQGLSKAETEGRPGVPPFLPSLDAARWTRMPPPTLRETFGAVVRGGYPECFSVPRMNVRRYFQSYVETYIERDVRDMVDVSNIGVFRTFMRVCAARTGQLLNYADLARDAGISVPTARSWLSMLEISGIVYILHPYYNNLIKRSVKTPKLYFTDTGLCSHLLGIATPEAAIDSPMSGALLETYVVMDICKSHWYAGSDAQFWFYRDGDRREVDLVIESGGRLHPVEIKRAAIIRPPDVKRGMAAFRAAASERAGLGAVAFLGDSFGALDADTALIPIASL